MGKAKANKAHKNEGYINSILYANVGKSDDINVYHYILFLITNGITKSDTCRPRIITI